MLVLLRKIVYRKNYMGKVLLLFLFSAIVCAISKFTDFCLFYIDIGNPVEYHFNIITVNSILSGFSLTNLGVLISVSSDQLIEKLKGTDILIKRNILISYSIIFGAISIFISLLFVLNFELAINNIVIELIHEFLFALEICSLILSIIYFLLSLRKMIQLLSYIYVPRNKYSEEKIELIKKQLNDNVSNKE